MQLNSELPSILEEVEVLSLDVLDEVIDPASQGLDLGVIVATLLLEEQLVLVHQAMEVLKSLFERVLELSDIQLRIRLQLFEQLGLRIQLGLQGLDLAHHQGFQGSVLREDVAFDLLDEPLDIEG